MPRSSRASTGVRYVGPILDEPEWARSPRAPPAGDGPLVLVTMSSTFQDQAGNLQRVADALSSLPVRGLITTGPAIDPDTVITPANVTVLPAAPHHQVLSHPIPIIARAAKRLLDEPKYQEAARTLGRAIRRDAAADTLIEQLQEVHHSTHLAT